MKAIYRRRLEKLAEHLLHGELGHQEFDFSCYNMGPLDIRGCGTSGCAIGECPIVFPKEWAFLRGPADHVYPLLINPPDLPVLTTKDNQTEFNAMVFFGITHWECIYLFFPSSVSAPWNAKGLSETATRKEVARGILNFLKFKTKQEGEND